MDNIILVTKARHNLSMPEMAEKLSVSMSYLTKIAYGYRRPGRNFITKFLMAFPEVSADNFF